MKALVYDAPETLTYRDMPDPAPGDGEELIRIESVGICGSDMHAYLGHDDRRPAPLILGHEGAGIVVGGALDGTRVTINPLVTDPKSAPSRAGRENLCPSRQIISMPPRQGAFAPYIAIPERNMVAVPDDISLEQAALAEPMAVSWHAVRLGVAALPPRADRRAPSDGPARKSQAAREVHRAPPRIQAHRKPQGTGSPPGPSPSLR